MPIRYACPILRRRWSCLGFASGVTVRVGVASPRSSVSLRGAVLRCHGSRCESSSQVVIGVPSTAMTTSPALQAGLPGRRCRPSRRRPGPVARHALRRRSPAPPRKRRRRTRSSSPGRRTRWRRASRAAGARTRCVGSTGFGRRPVLAEHLDVAAERDGGDGVLGLAAIRPKRRGPKPIENLSTLTPSASRR